MSKPKKISWYHRRILVDPAVQLKVIFTLGAVSLIFTFLICGLSIFWFMKLKSTFDVTLFGPTSAVEVLDAINDQLFLKFLAIMVLMFLSFLLVGLYITFRFAGPIWKLQRDLNLFLRGEQIEPVRFRKRDYYRSLPDLINELMRGYSRTKEKGNRLTSSESHDS